MHTLQPQPGKDPSPPSISHSSLEAENFEECCTPYSIRFFTILHSSSPAVRNSQSGLSQVALAVPAHNKTIAISGCRGRDVPMRHLHATLELSDSSNISHVRVFLHKSCTCQRIKPEGDQGVWLSISHLY